MTLALTQLTISHFRSHKHSRIECDARPIAIFGPNGAGKTNILEAVSLFSPGRGIRRASAQDMTRRPEALGWKLKGILNATTGPQEIETWSDEGAARQVKINDKTTPQTRLGELCRVIWLIPAMDRLWIEGAEGRRRFLDRTALSFFPDHAEAALTYEKTMRERNRLLKEQVRDAHWYRALEDQMAQAATKIHANRSATIQSLTSAQAQTTTAFPIAELEIQQTEGAIPTTEDDFKDAFAESRPRDIMAGRTLVGPHRSDLYAAYIAKGVPASECSTGEQKALLISLILANARALADQIGTPPILLLDEVAAHLDANRRAALYDEICALGAQAWMTGTEDGLFDSLGARGQYLEITETNGISESKTS
ncbi:DNA replication/repair protein RecF [Cognatishimia activa]|uniref:DNA replication and repair protein RecF n=1 Tax=Cognatishimia activa TaxID=1715691 RepID=A0A0P1J1G5_9RHOB|nr:DNA replication/repair protein RecF [Cognatishimia activa]CUI54743.1 DNA replication and repair protein RecF [Cognatishimia activa]CUK24343.1 DNA replication and repair protein RecF [Cognatishimia activa]